MFSRPVLTAVLTATALAGATAYAAPALNKQLLQRIAAYATQPDVVLQPPSGAPSPMAGSFVQAYSPPEGGVPDDKKVGTYQTASSPCSQKLVFESVPSDETRKEISAVETGIGASFGMQGLEIGGHWGKKSLAGMEYQITDKVVLTGGLEEMEACCVQSPERCTADIVAEWWKGTGKIYRLIANNTSIEATVKVLERAGSATFTDSRSWQMASEWSTPQFFAYRTQKVRVPACEEFMNNSPELEARVRFTGVSARKPDEQSARRDARDDARRQVVEYLGVEYQLRDGDAQTVAVAVLSGAKDDLTCMDPVLQDMTGPQFLARTRMYIDAARLQAAVAPLQSRTP